MLICPKAHSCVEKAAMIALVKIRLLETDEDYSLRGETLQKAIQEDIDQGLVPFFVNTFPLFHWGSGLRFVSSLFGLIVYQQVCCTLGTTCCCSFDNLMEIGPICQDQDLYLHVDAAYAGNALICDEYRPLMQGLEVRHVDAIYLRSMCHSTSFSLSLSHSISKFIDSINTCPNKWMLINFDCSCLWFVHNTLFCFDQGLRKN